MCYLLFSEIVDLYNRIVEQPGGSAGIRDAGALESALAQPRMTFEGEELFPGYRRTEMSEKPMKNSNVIKRLQKNRPMTQISIRMPEDVVEDLKRIAPRLGFSGYQPLIRAYIGQGLRADLARLNESPQINDLIDSLRKHGVEDEVIATAMAELQERLETSS